MNAGLPRPADGCGKCIAGERSVVVRPYIVRPDGEEGVRAYYRCPNCGHQWWTSWLTAYLAAEQFGSDGAA
jgi:hypothetical protein